MAIKVIGTTVIDDSRNIGNIGIATITTLNVGTGGTIITTTGTGLVGIGTTNPNSKLHVVGDIKCENNVTSTSISSQQINSPTSTVLFENSGIYVEGSGYFEINVGIGTSNPSQPLHVQGNTRVTGALYDSTNAPGTSGQVLQSTVSGTQWTSSAAIGFAVSTTSGNYTISQNDNGKIVSNSGNNAVLTVPTGLSTGFNVTLFNNTTGNQTFSVTGVTVYIAGSSVQISGTSILEQRGLATIVCFSSNTFVASGAGLR